MAAETFSMSVYPMLYQPKPGKLRIVQIRLPVRSDMTSGTFKYDFRYVQIRLPVRSNTTSGTFKYHFRYVQTRCFLYSAGPSTGTSRSISIREMMQKAVMAARAANLDVDDDTAIPTLHWPPDPPVVNTASSTAGTTPAVPTTAGTTSTDTPPPTVTGIV